MRATIAILLLLFMSNLHAQETKKWLDVYNDSKQNITMRATRSGSSESTNIKQAWVKTTYKVLETYKNNKLIKIANGYRLSRVDYDCSESKARVVSIVDYSPNGKVIISWTSDYPDAEPWNDVVPDSVREMELDFACENI